uniref:Exocyst complex component 7 n=1 Tax=Saccoglossus kowalevskii TaxID=10224 RepID=A0ABM0GJB5_SACKO|nr:PREDICTED: exocyst complex component 7-like [Saccoglossus kowalevskii]
MLAAGKGHGETNKKRVAMYVTKVLGGLGLNLDQKAKTYADNYLKYIFLLNNHHYILKSLQRSGLIKLVECAKENVEQQYEDIILEQKRQYSKSWSKVLTNILEVHKPVSSQRATPEIGGKLKDRDRQNIKDKFKGFNNAFEEIYQIQKLYAIPDMDLRKSLIEDNKNYILPPYKLFREKYASVQFTKNPDKYIKYTIDEVTNMMDKFFDASA